MGKRRVVGLSFVLIIFFMLVVFVNLIAFGGFTGFAVSEQKVISYETNAAVMGGKQSFNFEITNYEVQGKQLKVSYGLEDLIGEDRIVSANYKVFDGNGNINEGSQDVFLPAGSKKTYNFVVSVPDDYIGTSSLEVNFSDGIYSNSAKVEGIVFSNGGLNGNAILEGGKVILPEFAVILVAVFIVFFIASRVYHRKHSLRKLKSKINAGFIKLDLEK